jgi:hypothetical protein
MVHQSGRIAGEWKQDTENIFDVPLNTEGLSAYIPELKSTFGDKVFEVDVRAVISSKLTKPIIKTSSSGADITFKWKITFEVHENEDEDDPGFPEEYLILELESFINVNFLVHDDYIQVFLAGQNIKNVTAVLNKLKDYNPSKNLKLLNNLFTKILDACMKNHGNVRIYDILKNKTGLNFKDVSIIAQNGFYSLAIDLE